jgi:hypothetical protein
MIRTAKRQTLKIWIAILAILFSALAPTFSHALAAANVAGSTMEVCTANGYKVVQIPGAEDGKIPSTVKHGMEHCAFCATHGGPFAPPASSSLIFPIDAGRDSYPPLFYAAPRALHAWSAANPRAPPAVA